MSELQRISDYFLDRRKAYLAATMPEMRERFENILRSTSVFLGQSYRRQIMRAAQELCRENISPWLLTEEEEGERQYRVIARRFVQNGQ